MAAAITTVIGPVGPEICVGVPPKKEAKNPNMIAPYIPAVAPSPLATPNARPNGSATTAAVKPPKIFFCKLKVIFTSSMNVVIILFCYNIPLILKKRLI